MRGCRSNFQPLVLLPVATRVPTQYKSWMTGWSGFCRSRGLDGFGGLIVNTIFGPVEVAGAVGNYGRGKFFFRIGRIF